MRQIGALCCVIGGFFAAPAAGQEQVWLQQWGSSRPDAVEHLAPDEAGGVYAVWVVSASFSSVYSLSRYDGDGMERWEVRLRVPTEIADVAADGAGGLLLAGGDSWFARYDSAGTELWSRTVGGRAFAIEPDGASGFFVGGITGEDAWLARYTLEGDQLWRIQFGDHRTEALMGLASDGAGGVFAATQVDTYFPTVIQDVRLARYDSAGAQTWNRDFGGRVLGRRQKELVPDGAGGFFFWSVPTAAPARWILSRRAADGAALWERDWSDARIGSMAFDPTGSLLLAGLTSTSFAGPHLGRQDAWAAQADMNGDFVWQTQFGTTNDDAVNGVAPDQSGGLYVGGGTAGSLGGPGAGQNDAFLARYGDRCPADCDGSGDLTFFDFLCFQNLFAAGDPGADCDGDGTLTFFDFLCFQNAFAAGCP